MSEMEIDIGDEKENICMMIQLVVGVGNELTEIDKTK